MGQTLLHQTFRIMEPDGVPSNRVVVYGDRVCECALPPGMNCGRILGVTTIPQPMRDGNVVVCRAGIARVEAAGRIRLGDPLRVAGVDGRVRALKMHWRTWIVGFADTEAETGDIVSVFLAVQQVTLPQKKRRGGRGFRR